MEAEAESAAEDDALPPADEATPSPKFPRWAAWLLVALVLVALALIALWHFRAASVSDATPDAIAQEYLAALAAQNPTRPQQLATEESRGVLPPVWYTIAGGHALGKAEMLDARTARLPVELRVMQPTQAALRLPEVDPAVYRAYRVTVSLKREGGEWRVDQRQAFQALWNEMRTQNPGAKVPPP